MYLNVKHIFIKCLAKIIRRNHQNLGFDENFLDMEVKAQSTRQKN